MPYTPYYFGSRGGGSGSFAVPGTGQYANSGGGYGGGGPFGTRVAPIPMPNPAADLGSVFPNLPGTNAALSSDINAQLGGKLSPGTLAAMQDYEASFAAGSGMPGSNAIPGTLGYNRGVRDIGLTAEGQVKAGEAAYNSTIPTISRTQTVDPSLQSNINEENAINLSAPDPAAAQSYAQQLFDKYLAQLRGPGGASVGHGPAGGTGNFASVSHPPNLSAPGSGGSGFDSGPWSRGYPNFSFGSRPTDTYKGIPGTEDWYAFQNNRNMAASDQPPDSLFSINDPRNPDYNNQIDQSLLDMFGSGDTNWDAANLGF